MSLKQSILLAVKNFPIERVRAGINNWPRRLKGVAVIGGHFEHALYIFNDFILMC